MKATNLAISALEPTRRRMSCWRWFPGVDRRLLEAPRMGVTLADLARTTDLLLRAGAPIEALNAVRAPLSRVKAGGLARRRPRSDLGDADPL